MKPINNLLLLLLLCLLSGHNAIMAQITVWDIMDVPVGGCPIPPFQDTAMTAPVWITPIKRNFPYRPSVSSMPPPVRQIIAPDSVRKIFLPYLTDDYPKSTSGHLKEFTSGRLDLSVVTQDDQKNQLLWFLSAPAIVEPPISD